jgi:hypothetical protein
MPTARTGSSDAFLRAVVAELQACEAIGPGTMYRAVRRSQVFGAVEQDA